MVDIKKINNKLNKISVKIDYLQEQLEDNLDEKDNLGFLYKFYIIVDNYIKPYDINYNV